MENFISLLKFLDTTAGLASIVAAATAMLVLTRYTFRHSANPVLQSHAGMLTLVAAIVLFGLLFLAISFSFPSRGEVDAAAVPRLWFAALAAMCLYLVVSTMRGNQEADPEPGHMALPFKFIGISVVYVVLINLLGFYIATGLFLVSGMLLLAYRRWVVIVAVTGGWILFSYLIFFKALFVPLPDGALVQLLTR